MGANKQGNQWFASRINFRRLSYTTALSLIPSGFITLCIVFIYPNALSVNVLWFLFIIMMLSISVLLYSLEYVALKLESRIFPRKHDLQISLKTIAAQLQSTTSFDELKEVTLRDIVRTLELSGAAIVFKYADDTERMVYGDWSNIEVETLIQQQEAVEGSVHYTVLEMNKQKQYASYLILAGKQNNTILSLEERKWLEMIVSYLAVNIENLQLIRKLTTRLEQMAEQIPNEAIAYDVKWFRRLMFELQEKERERIASDLHETTMQDLFFHKRRLYALLEKNTLLPDDQELMIDMIHHVDLMSSHLQQSCFELNPLILHDMGLIHSMEKWVEQEKGFCPFTISFVYHLSQAIEDYHEEAKKHIFRMVQELITNARKHSQASHVRIEFKESAADFIIAYTDNGIGFDYDQTKRSLVETAESGIGLTQIASRVLYLNGLFAVQSKPGEGVKIDINVPKMELSRFGV